MTAERIQAMQRRGATLSRCRFDHALPYPVIHVLERGCMA